MTPTLSILFCIVLNSGLTEQKVKPEIVNLGKNMIEQLANKTRENANSLYENFSTYLKLLQEINDLIWSKNGDVVSKGMGIFDDLEDTGGPPHATQDLDYQQLQDTYGWKEGEIKQIKSLVNDTRVLWEAVKDRANRLRIGTWGVDSKVEEEPAPGDEESEGELH